MSVKKIYQAEKQGAEGEIDLLAAAFVTHQVRELLRFHQNMGIEDYPASAELTGFLNRKASHPKPSRTQPRRERPSRLTQIPTPVQKTPPSAPIFQPSALSLQTIRQEISNCKACVLAEHRQGQVLGSSVLNKIRLMVVGDWSRQIEIFAEDILFGLEEDVMLWRMMEAIGLNRNDVYVSNVIKCCPAGTPERDCAAHCLGYLSREIAALKPGLIMAMGEMATAHLLGASAPLVRLRGRFHAYRYPDSAPARIMPTFHPRFLLANPEMKTMVWQDLQMVQRQLTV